MKKLRKNSLSACLRAGRVIPFRCLLVLAFHWQDRTSYGRGICLPLPLAIKARQHNAVVDTLAGGKIPKIFFGYPNRGCMACPAVRN